MRDRDPRPGDRGRAGNPERLGRPDGTGIPDRHGIADGTGGSTGAGERELRILLERATPRLVSPEGRLEQIRERIRRRRRRAVGATATAVTVLALAGTLLPAALRDPGPVPPAAPSVSVGPSVSSPSGTAGEHTAEFPHLAGLRLRLPEGWQSLEVPEAAESKAPARGFAADQPLRAFRQPCAVDGARTCLPLGRLRPGGALLELTLEKKPGRWPLKVRKLGLPLDRLPKPTPACRSIGGVYSYTAVIAGAKGSRALVSVALCGAEDMPERTVNEMTDSVEDARYAEAPRRQSTSPRALPGTRPGTNTPTLPGTSPGTDRTGERR
ncbi:hypothetical protein ACIBCM_13815 [Streptomyces sp. NPDC051018]|uniref:hypothetical protein n=1 Tax=Streptomyces sp. NPDC051018 TaxID=3365639 RepID=UPI0037885372